MFDLVRWLEREGVEVVARGSNVARGHVNIQCPFCGPLDHSHHMGVKISEGWWGCWRDSKHRGKSPVKLIMALKRCSYETACTIVGFDSTPPPESLGELRARLKAVDDPPAGDLFVDITLPSEFKPPQWEGPRRKFCEFLRRYRVPDSHISQFVAAHELLCSIRGEWQDRLIVPMRDPKTGKLWGWSGRTVLAPNGFRPRYKAHPPGPQLKTIPYVPKLREYPQTLVIVEGPVDAMKLDFYSGRDDVQVLACQGTSMTPEQINIVLDLQSGADQILISFDPGAAAQATALRSSLAFLPNVRIAPVPEGVEDFGDALPDTIADWVEQNC